MKRFALLKEVVSTVQAAYMEQHHKVMASMKEDPNGAWVHWSEVEKQIEFLKNQIPEHRIAKLEKALGLVHEGKCPECEQPVRNYNSPHGSFAPEMWASLREAGINPATGHKEGCKLA